MPFQGLHYQDAVYYNSDQSLILAPQEDGFIFTNFLLLDDRDYRGEILKEIFSAGNIPELKASTCTKSVRVPCPTTTNPFRMCNKNVSYPCIYKRTSTYKVYLRVRYPDTIDQEARKLLQNCVNIATGVALKVLATEMPGAISTGGAAVAAVVAKAYTAFQASFTSCISGISVLSVIKGSIKTEIYQKMEPKTDWHLA